mgnify:CR=1 FL=1
MSEPEKKSDVVRRLVRERDYRSALRIAKEFRLGISKEDRDAMRLAYECMVSPKAGIECGVSVLVRLYGNERR